MCLWYSKKNNTRSHEHHTYIFITWNIIRPEKKVAHSPGCIKIWVLCTTYIHGCRVVREQKKFERCFVKISFFSYFKWWEERRVIKKWKKIFFKHSNDLKKKKIEIFLFFFSKCIKKKFTIFFFNWIQKYRSFHFSSPIPPLKYENYFYECSCTAGHGFTEYGNIKKMTQNHNQSATLREMGKDKCNFSL